MIIVNVNKAKTNLARLLAEVEAGRKVVIARNGKPVARLVKYERLGRRQFGALSDRITVDDSFFDPMPEEELAAWEG